MYVIELSGVKETCIMGTLLIFLDLKILVSIAIAARFHKSFLFDRKATS